MDTPVATYWKMDFPPDHLNDTMFGSRLDVLVPMEKTMIASYSQMNSYRQEFYESCFDSFVPLSEDGSKAFLKKNRNNVYLGVRRDKNGDCEGCSLKSPIHMSTDWRRIRKFVGNREVFDIITNENGSHVIS